MHWTDLALAAALVSGCADHSPLECAVSADCLQAGVHGTCQPSPSSSHNWCTFPDESCGTGDRWGVLAGDGLASACVGSEGADAMPSDTGPELDGGADGGPQPATSTRIFVVGYLSADRVSVFDAESLDPLGDIMPPFEPNAVAVVDATLWVKGTSLANDDSEIAAYDPGSALLKPGYPKAIPSSTCKLLGSMMTDDGLYCIAVGASGTADDVVVRLTPPSFSIAKTSPNLPQPSAIGGTTGVVLVTLGSGSAATTIAVLKSDLVPVTGSPITGAIGGADKLIASTTLGRIAIANAKSAELYEFPSLARIGAPVSYSDSASPIRGMAFDEERGSIVITFSDGSVTSRAVSDFSELVAKVNRGGSGSTVPIVDPTRDRIYFADRDIPTSGLIVLDATTLDHVAGSPIAIPDGGRDLAAF